MIDSIDDFSRYSIAERQLCDSAGPLFAEVVRAVEANTGIVIKEVRITFDRTINSGELLSANCTIVRAEPASQPATRNLHQGPNQSALE